MTRHCNLTLDDFEFCAESVHRTIKAGREPMLVYVLPNGALKTIRRNHPAQPPADYLIGCFTPKTPIEVIENDLLDRQRELRTEIQLREAA